VKKLLRRSLLWLTTLRYTVESQLELNLLRGIGVGQRMCPSPVGPKTVLGITATFLPEGVFRQIPLRSFL